MNKAIEIISFVVMLVGSMTFGFLGKPTEMALAIIAGAIAFSFANIDKFSKIKGAGFEAELKEQIEAVVEKETEPELNESGSKFSYEAYGLDEKATPIVLALKNSKFTWRYIGGISKESKASSEKVFEILNWLTSNNLANESKGSKGRIWSLTKKGREVFANIS